MLLRVPSTEANFGCDPSISLLEHGDVPESIGWTDADDLVACDKGRRFPQLFHIEILNFQEISSR